MNKSVEQLTFTDDKMFQTVLNDPQICAELIERLLHVRVDHVEYPELEKAIEPYYTSKGVRLDVYIKDSDKVIDIECQANLKSALGKRTRYYQSMIDIDNLMKGEEYDKLKESYILFICKDDPFKDAEERHYGLPCYTFKNVCTENSNVNLDDKTIKVLYNASAYEKEEDPLIRGFLHYIYTGEPGEDDFAKKLYRLVEQTKKDDIFRKDYLAMNLHDHDIRYEALQDGKQEQAIESAKTMLADKLSPEKVSLYSGLPLEQVLELQKNIPMKN